MWLHESVSQSEVTGSDWQEGEVGKCGWAGGAPAQKVGSALLETTVLTVLPVRSG